MKTIYYRDGITKNDLTGSGWSTVIGELMKVEVGDCQVYGVTLMHTIHKRIAVSE